MAFSVNFVPEIIDEAIKSDVRYEVNRNMRVVDLADDGNYLKIWVSARIKPPESNMVNSFAPSGSSISQ